MDRRFILSRQETVQIFHKMVNRGIFSVQYHILKPAAENDAKDAAHSWKQSSFNVAKTNYHPTKLNDQYAALRCKTSADLGFWCTWRSFAAADELANGLFVLQHRLRHKSTLCIPRMTRHSRSSGVWKGIRQTEFCHYFPTRVFSLFSDTEEFAGTEGLDVLWLTQDADLVRTAWDEHQPIGSSNSSGQHLLFCIRGHLFHNSQEDKGDEKCGWNAQKRCGKLICLSLSAVFLWCTL